MSDFRQESADRLERAADRMYNSGFLDEERRFRAAAAEIRAGLSIEETQALERELIGGRKSGVGNKLTALAAQGEYDGDDSSSDSSAQADASDEIDVTEMESGVSQLLSTASSTGISDPYSPAQGGWVSAPQSVDPYTGAAAGDGDGGSAFTGGQNINPYTSAAPDDDNPNPFTGSQNVNPLTGGQNTDPFSAGSTPSLLSSPYLLANNDTPNVANANIASDAGGPNYIGPVNGAVANANFDPSISDTGADTGGSTYVGTFTENGVTYYRFADIGGTVYDMRADTDTNPSPAPSGSTAPGGPGTASPVVPAPNAPPTATPGPAPTDENASPAPDPSATPPATPQTASPPPDTPAAANDSSTAQPAGSPQQGTTAVPFDPMADSPVAKWLLYGTDTPVLDFLTNDANLRTAQNVAAGVAVVAGTIATGGMLLEAAPGAFAAFGGAQSISAAAAPLATGAAGVVAANPNLPEEIEEELQGTLPALGPQVDNVLQQVEEEAPSLAEQANVRFQDQVRAARQFFADDLSRVLDYGGSSRLSGGLPVPVSPEQLGYAAGNPSFAQVLTGNAMEARVFEQILTDPQDYQLFDQLSGAGRIDFVGTGEFEGFTFELTTEGGVAAHSLREYLQQPGAFIFTYPPLL